MQKKIMNKKGLVLGLCVGFSVSYPAYSQDCKDLVSSTPTTDFTVHAEGTVTHNPTGLMWKICSEGQTYENNSCVNDASVFTWPQALTHVDELNANTGFAGYTDWRLPNIKELNALVEVACYQPAINESLFPSTVLARYLTSSPKMHPLTNLVSDSAWSVNFIDGSIPNSGDLSPAYQGDYLRLVRH